MKICRGRQPWNKGTITSVRGWKKDPDEREIACKYVWSYNQEGREGKPVRIVSQNFLNLEALGVGEKATYWMSAPGSGKITYKITRITKTKVFAKMIEDTSYILTEADVI